MPQLNEFRSLQLEADSSLDFVAFCLKVSNPFRPPLFRDGEVERAHASRRSKLGRHVRGRGAGGHGEERGVPLPGS